VYAWGSAAPLELLGAVSTIVGIPVTLIGALVALRRWEQIRPTLGTPEQLSLATEALAETMSEYWIREAQERGITTPAPVSVHWHGISPESWSDLDVMGGPTEGVGPKPLPATWKADPATLSEGVVTALHGLYSALPYGRLVILGGPGTGKTSAGILLMLAALRARKSRPSTERDVVPVPVMLTLDGWDPSPHGQSLRDWAAAKIYRDNRYLHADAYGPRATERLLNVGAVSLFLDGLDEMPASAQAAAAWRIAQEAELRIVLMSRPEAFENAVKRDHLPNTAVIVLEPVDAEKVGAYLRQGGRRWERFVDDLFRNRAGPAAQIMSTPLALTLLRTAYREAGDPVELLDSTRFPTAESIWEHLLDALLIAAFPHDRRRIKAMRWLGHLARHMHQAGKRDLAWWQIPMWTPWRTRLGGGLAIGLTTGLIVGLSRAAGTALETVLRDVNEIGLAAAFDLALTDGLDIAIPSALISGLAAWLVAMLVAGRSLNSAPRDVTMRWPTVRDVVTGLVLGSAIGLLIGLVLAVSLIFEPWDRPSFKAAFTYWLISDLPVVMGFSVGAGLVVGLVAGTATSWLRPTDGDRAGVTPRTAFNRDIRATLVAGLTGALMGSFTGWIAASLTGAGPLSGAMLGGLLLGLAVMFVLGLGPALWLLAVGPVMRITGHGPLLTIAFLEAARQRQVLRQAGAVYQFRHAELQDRLAKWTTAGGDLSTSGA
jgi:hypothetical protein